MCVFNFVIVTTNTVLIGSGHRFMSFREYCNKFASRLVVSLNKKCVGNQQLKIRSITVDIGLSVGNTYVVPR